MSTRRRFNFDHPTRAGVEIAYGLDHALPGGFFAELREGTRVTSFDGITPSSKFDPYGATLEQVLRWIAAQGAYSDDDLEEVLLLRESGDRVPERLTLVARVVEDLLRAADG